MSASTWWRRNGASRMDDARRLVALSGIIILIGGVARARALGLISTAVGGDVRDGGAATAAALGGPSAVAVDASGDLFIADTGNNRIRKVTPQGIITTVAGTGETGFSGDGGPATRTALRWPTGVAVDASGDLFIADSENNRIRKVDPRGIITTVAGSGEPGFSGDGGPATQAQLFHPQGLAVDAAGDLFIADTGTHRIRKVDPEGIITTVAGTGVVGFAGDGGAPDQAQLDDPEGVALDAAGNLLIADTNNNRVRRVDGVAAAGLVAGQPLPGSAGTLRVGDAFARPGQTVRLSLQADASLHGIAGAQVTLEAGSFLHPAISSIAVGSLLAGAGATISADDRTPGRLTLRIAGPLPHDGPGAVASFCVGVDASTPPGLYPLELSDVTLSGPNGQALPVRSIDGTLVVLRAGDIDFDGQVDIGDAVLALRAVAGLAALSPEQASAADMNHDGKVDHADVSRILAAAIASM